MRRVIERVICDGSHLQIRKRLHDYAIRVDNEHVTGIDIYHETVRNNICV
jgi:hypothetical protein